MSAERIRGALAKAALVLLVSLVALTLVRFGLTRPSLLSAQMHALTSAGGVFATGNGFANFLLNVRLVELILFAAAATALLVEVLERGQRTIVLAWTLSLLAVVLFNQLVARSPFPTMPELKRHLSAEAYALEYAGFLLLAVLMLSCLELLALSLYVYGKRASTASSGGALESSLIATAALTALTALTRDYVVAYLLLMSVFLLALSAVVAKKR